MRVVFTGQSGIEKSKIIENLVHHIQRLCDSQDGKNKFDPKKIVSWHAVEEKIASDLPGFLGWHESPNEKEQSLKWKNAFEDLLVEIEREKPLNVFLSLHSVLSKYGRFISPLDWDQLRRFSPDIFITFIDDVYDIWWRLRKRQESFPAISEFRLREILAWRSIEIMMTGTIAKNLIPGKPLNHYIVAVKHPLSMLLKLILEPKTIRVYAGYPITHTRNQSKDREIIDKHRKRLHQSFVTFDPVTIDEYILKVALDEWEAQKPRPSTITLNRKKARWPLPSDGCEFPLIAESLDYPEVIEGIDPEQIKEIVNEIYYQIEWRDYRLLDQAHCFAAYRPYYKGTMSKGVSSEIDYALSSGIQAYQFWPGEDGSNRPFQTRGTIIRDYDEFIHVLEQHQKEIQGSNISPSHGSEFDGYKY